MTPQIDYSPFSDDLYYPCKNADFFQYGNINDEHSLCAEMARLAYSRSSSDFAFDQKKIEQELKRIQFTAVGFFESSRVAKNGGTHCFIAARRDAGLAVVAFRGTDKNDFKDLLDDLNCLPVSWEKQSKVHEGFAKALGEVSEPVLKALTGIKGRVLFTGHSLGAALATLLASMVKPEALYTFGSPRVGDAKFVSMLHDVESFRYVDCCDVVTTVPPEQFGYLHVGPPHFITEDRSVMHDPDQELIDKNRRFAPLKYFFKYQAWRPGRVAWRSLADHAPVNYVAAVSASAPPALKRLAARNLG